jgi:hypothetical protein
MLADDMKIRELNAEFYFSSIGVSLSTPTEPSE